MIILNLPFGGSLPQRMVTVMAWGFAIAGGVLKSML
jgi:hypothetical protein